MEKRLPERWETEEGTYKAYKISRPSRNPFQANATMLLYNPSTGDIIGIADYVEKKKSSKQKKESKAQENISRKVFYKDFHALLSSSLKNEFVLRQLGNLHGIENIMPVNENIIKRRLLRCG